MRTSLFVRVVLLLVAAAAALAAQTRPPSPQLGAALRAYFAASSPRDAEKLAPTVVASGADFALLWDQVRAGRSYDTQRGGTLELPSTDHGIALDNVVEIPHEYDPARRWPIRVSLHGGVGREPPRVGEPPARPLSNRIPGRSEIVIHPRAWAQSEWWTSGQVDNISTLLDRVKRRFNVDESLVYVTGISDGGTGVYFLAMRAATPWSACLPLNGHPSVLANPDVGADGQLFSANLVNCPMHIVNGGRDRLYPAASVAPLVEMFRRGGVPLEFQIYPEAGHDVSWWPQERSRYEAFLTAHPRVAHPERISWETERTDRYNRFRWLVIDRLGRRSSDVRLEDVNTFSPLDWRSGRPEQRQRAPTPAMAVPLFDRSKASGRVDVTRRGNAFEVKTRGVQQFTLLLSPDVIDFSRPVQLTVNGRSVLDRIVTKDSATLLKWAARDNDRTMLYGAELTVTVP